MARGGYRPNAGRPKAQHTIQAEAAKARLIELFMEEKEPVFKALIKAVTEAVELTGKDGKDLFPVPILSNVNVPTNNGNQENSQPGETDQGSTGRHISE
jgi:hypothetical protein